MDKESIRQRIWDELEATGEARFPFPPHGRIPNFAGAPEAAALLTDVEEWRSASVVKANPDSPQRPVRRGALEAGKTVYQAVPRLREEAAFLELDPERIDDYDEATTLSGSEDLGISRSPDEMPAVDLVVSGSVAVDESGARIGKGEGYSDLEYAVLRELGLVDDGTTVVTTVHEMQVVDDEWPVADHDVPMDLVVTPDRVVRTDGLERYGRPDGIDWDLIDEERVEEVPLLERFRP